MKHFSIIAAILVSFVYFTAPVMVTAAEAAQTLTGTLSTETNDNDAVVKATLTVEETTYNIVLDKTGKELADKMSDKKVEVTAVVSKKEVEAKDEDDNTIKTTELWLTVSAYKPVTESASEDSEE